MTEEVKLDRKRSFGTTYNDPNIAFVQDGRYFRQDGTLYVPPESIKTEEPPKKDVLTRSGVVSK